MQGHQFLEHSLLISGVVVDEGSEVVLRQITNRPPSMKPEHRFHSYVTAATVLMMFYFIRDIVPQLNFSPAINKFLHPVVSLLTSIGIYKAFATLLLKAAKQWKWVKRWLLGASYLNGTWVGKFQGTSGETILTVEHFEQSVSSLKVRGQGFRLDGTYAYWNSVSEMVDEEVGLLSYTYNCDKTSDKGSFQGVAVFHFERSNEACAPSSLRGYSADLIDGHRTENAERKISEDLLPFADALLQAKA